MRNSSTIDLKAIAERTLLAGADRHTISDGGHHDHRNPATGTVQATVALAGPDSVDAAVQAARTALPAWRSTPAHKRQHLLNRLADLVVEHADELTTIGALESGTPVMHGAGSPRLAARWIRYYAGWCDKIDGGLTPPWSGTEFDYVVPEPYGVVGVIIPWNGPLMSLCMKAPAALAAGNTVVAKPAELAPFAALRLGELALEAGLPPGVFNIVPAGPEGGGALVTHPDVDKISFTGGGPTAKAIMRAAAEHLKPLTLELGGKSANIVFADADVDRAVMMAWFGVFAFSGQACVAPTRLYVHDEVYDEVIDRLIASAEGTVLGDPLDPVTSMGPVISDTACDRIIATIDTAEGAGAGKLLTGGHRARGHLADGYFVEPTVFGDVDHDSPLARTEIFGPVLAVLRFNDEAEVVAKANDSEFGLGAYLFTRDLARAHRVAHQLEAGWVNVNGSGGLMPTVPFGGMKQSGFGREGGRAGLEEFLCLKAVHLAL